jgi:hypothetical protein
MKWTGHKKGFGRYGKHKYGKRKIDLKALASLQQLGKQEICRERK